jgi:hypothetical protein
MTTPIPLTIMRLLSLRSVSSVESGAKAAVTEALETGARPEAAPGLPPPAAPLTIDVRASKAAAAAGPLPAACKQQDHSDSTAVVLQRGSSTHQTH